MDNEVVRRHELLQQVKRGRQTGLLQWTRLFVILVSAVEVATLVLDVHRGRGTVTLLADGIVMVFILAMAAMGLGVLETNQRFVALIALIGEDKLLRSD